MAEGLLSKDYPVLFAEWTRLLDAQDLEAANAFYFEKILPAILPIVRARSLEIPKYNALISLLGFTPETVILTSQLLKPDSLVVLHTPETEQFLDVVSAHCGLPISRFHHESFLHDDEHIDDIYVGLKNALARFKRDEHIAIELTGGKKTMGVQLANAAAALRHNLGISVDIVYIDYDDYMPKYRKPVPETSRLLIIQDPPATAYAIFGDVEHVGTATREVLVNPLFRGRGFPIEHDFAFVLMPFNEPWSDRIWKLIRDECTELKFRAKRADNLFGHDIMEDIWRSISQARVVLADLTNRNPNVFYELGLAHTLGKRFILITQSLDDVPFDLNRYRCIIYEDNLDGYEKLRNGLRNMLRHH